MREQAISMLAIAVCIGFAGMVSAHHSMAGYDDTKKITLSGVVSEYRWRNPHAWVVWDVKDESGKIVQWSGELPAITGRPWRSTAKKRPNTPVCSFASKKSVTKPPAPKVGSSTILSAAGGCSFLASLLAFS